MHFLFMYLSSIVANKGILTYKEKTSYDLCESYLIDNLDYYNNFSAYSERLWAEFFKQKKNDRIKSTLMSLIPLYNYIYCSLRYPDIEDEYLDRAEELFKKINDYEKKMREHNKDIYNYIFNTSKDEGISEPFLIEALEQFKKQKEALEYIKDNNLTNDYDENVLKYLNKKNKKNKKNKSTN